MTERSILGIDPGPTQSGWAILDGDLKVTASGVLKNGAVIDWFLMDYLPSSITLPPTMAIEKIEAMGMTVGAEVFETVHWAGRMQQAFPMPDNVIRVTRREVKLFLCGSMQAKDKNIRQALIDRLGPPGVKKAPGGTYGVTSHAWSALAVALTAAEQMRVAA